MRRNFELCRGSSPDSTSRAPSQLPLHETVTVQNRANALHQPGAQSPPAAIILFAGDRRQLLLSPHVYILNAPVPNVQYVHNVLIKTKYCLERMVTFLRRSSTCQSTLTHTHTHSRPLLFFPKVEHVLAGLVSSIIAAHSGSYKDQHGL